MLQLQVETKPELFLFSNNPSSFITVKPRYSYTN